MKSIVSFSSKVKMYFVNSKIIIINNNNTLIAEVTHEEVGRNRCALQLRLSNFIWVQQSCHALILCNVVNPFDGVV